MLYNPARRASSLDPALIWSAILLASIGLVMVYSASIATAEAERFTGFRAGYFLARHSIYMAIGVVITYVLGVTSAETSWRAAIARSGQSMREWIDDATAKAVEVSRDNAEIQESLRARRGADPELLQERMFAFGLECVLDGFAARVGS